MNSTRMPAVFAQCMDNRAQDASRYLALKRKLHQDFAQNQVDVYALNIEDLTRLWIATQIERGQSQSQISEKFRELIPGKALEFTRSGIEILDDYGAALITASLDSKALVALGADLKKSGNLLGAYRTSVHNGRRYIIFKGNHRLRTVLRGTRYRINNPLVVKLGIGSEGLKSAAKGGAYVTLFVSATVNTLSWLFDESFGWRDFISNMSEDLLKAAIAALAGYFTAKAFAAGFGFLLVSKALGFGVGVAVSFGLDAVERQDIDEFAQRMAEQYQRATSMLSNPKALVHYGMKRAEDVLICGVSSTGTLVVEAVHASVKARIQQLVRRFSPLGIR